MTFIKNHFMLYLSVILVSFISGAIGSTLVNIRVNAQAQVNRNIISTTQGFYLVSSDNKPLASLSSEGTKNPNLTMYDKVGRKRLRLGFTYEGTPTLTTFDDKGVPRIYIGVKINDQPGIIIYNSHGKVSWKSS